MPDEIAAQRTEKDAFSIDIVLRHKERSAESISRALSILGHPLGVNAFIARLQVGDNASDYSASLQDLVEFLNMNKEYWRDFIRTGGEAEIVLNHTIPPGWESGDKCFELQLASSFLNQLSCIGVGLRIQGWQGHKS